MGLVSVVFSSLCNQIHEVTLGRKCLSWLRVWGATVYHDREDRGVCGFIAMTEYIWDSLPAHSSTEQEVENRLDRDKLWTPQPFSHNSCAPVRLNLRFYKLYKQFYQLGKLFKCVNLPGIFSIQPQQCLWRGRQNTPLLLPIGEDTQRENH